MGSLDAYSRSSGAPYFERKAVGSIWAKADEAAPKQVAWADSVGFREAGPPAGTPAVLPGGPPMRAMLLPFLLLEIGCGLIGKNSGMTADQLLTHKIQCAQQGREFWKANQNFYSDGDNIAFHTEWFTYSPRLNTCVLYEDQHTKAEGEIQYFVDILTSRDIVPASITGKGQIDGESLKTLYELFREANVDVRVDGLEVYMKSRREAK
jgi:hypothetical protein